MRFAIGIVALSGALVVASIAHAPAHAQGSLRLPPLPGQKNEPATATPQVPGAPPSQAKPSTANSGWPTDPSQQVKAIQVLLRDLGLYNNTTNGTLGPATRAAIREFQRTNNEPQTGEPSEQLFNELQQKKAN